MSGITESSKFNDFIIYLLAVFSGFLVALISIIYNNISKSIQTLFKYKDDNEKKVSGIGEKVSAMKATCDERGHKNDNKKD